MKSALHHVAEQRTYAYRLSQERAANINIIIKKLTSKIDIDCQDQVKSLPYNLHCFLEVQYI